MFFSFSKIGDFHLKEETVVMKRKATKPGGSGREKSQVSPFKMFDFACEERHVDPKAQEKRISSRRASGLRKQAGR